MEKRAREGDGFEEPIVSSGCDVGSLCACSCAAAAASAFACALLSLQRTSAMTAADGLCTLSLLSVVFVVVAPLDAERLQQIRV